MEREEVNLGETKGISRRVDELGRIVIPMEFRKELNIDADEKEWLEIFLLNDGIFIRKKKFMYKNEK